MTDHSSHSLTISSSAFAEGAGIPPKYTCQGDNISPPLTIEGVSDKVKSLALIMHDPDAPNGDYTHWLIWDINPSTKDIAENSVPAGSVQGLNDFGENQYGGPCPPSGTHHYIFELYTLDHKLELPASSKQANLRQAIKDHIIDQTSLTGLFAK